MENKIIRCLESNHGSLASEATTLPIYCLFLSLFFVRDHYLEFHRYLLFVILASVLYQEPEVRIKSFICCFYLLYYISFTRAIFFKKWVNPGLFFVYFRSFQTNISNFTTKICEKCPSSIRCRDSNP